MGEPKTLKELRDEIAKDGTPVPSALSLTAYVVPAPPAVCEDCHRGPTYYEGCSMAECPQRRAMSVREWK